MPGKEEDAGDCTCHSSKALCSSSRDQGDIGIRPALFQCHMSWCWLGLHIVVNKLTAFGSCHVEGAFMCGWNQAIVAIAWLRLLCCGFSPV